MFPPDPWNAKQKQARADGPMFPPDPWSTSPNFAILDGPMFPPDPWSTTDKKNDGTDKRS
jgi:hypothetical protein